MQGSSSNRGKPNLGPSPQQKNNKAESRSSENQKSQKQLQKADIPNQTVKQMNSAPAKPAQQKDPKQISRVNSAKTLIKDPTPKPSQSKETSPARIQKVQKVIKSGDTVVTQETVKSQKIIKSKIDTNIKKKEGTLNIYSSNTKIERTNSRSKSREKKPEQKPKQMTIAEKLAFERNKKNTKPSKPSQPSRPSSGQVSRNSSPLSKDSKGSSQKQQKLATSKMAPKQVIQKLENHKNDLKLGKKDFMKKKQETLSAGSKQQSDDENQFHKEENTAYPAKFPTITITQCSDSDIPTNLLSSNARFENQEDDEDLMSDHHNNQFENGDLNNSIDDQDINLDNEQLRQEQFLIESQMRQQQQSNQDLNEIEDNQLIHQAEEECNQNELDQNSNDEDQQNDNLSINDDVESQQQEKNEDIQNSQAFSEYQMTDSQKQQDQKIEQQQENEDNQQAEQDCQIDEPELENKTQEVERESKIEQENITQNIKPPSQEQNIETQEIIEINSTEQINQKQGLQSQEEFQRIAERLLTIQEEEEAARLNTEVFEMQSNQTGSPIMLNELIDDSNNNSEIQQEQLALDKDFKQDSKKKFFESEQRQFFVKKQQQIINFNEEDDQLLNDQEGQEALQETHYQNSQIQSQQVNQENKQNDDQLINTEEISNNDNQRDQKFQEQNSNAIQQGPEEIVLDQQENNENSENPKQQIIDEQQSDNCQKQEFNQLENSSEQLNIVSKHNLNNLDQKEVIQDDQNQSLPSPHQIQIEQEKQIKELNVNLVPQISEFLLQTHQLEKEDSSSKNINEQQNSNLQNQRPLILIEENLEQINKEAQNIMVEEQQNQSDEEQGGKDNKNSEEQLLDQEQNNSDNIQKNSRQNEAENKSQQCIDQAQDQQNKHDEEEQNKQENIQNDEDDEDYDFLAELQKEFIHETNQEDDEDVSPDNKVPQNEDQEQEENQQQDDNKIPLIDQNNQPESKPHQNIELMQENETIEEEDQDVYSEESFLVKRKNQSNAISPNMQIPKKLEQNEISLQIEKEPLEQQCVTQIEQELPEQVLEMEVEENKEENKQMEIQNKEVQQDNVIQQEDQIDEVEEKIRSNNGMEHDQQNIVEQQVAQSEITSNQQQEENNNQQESVQIEPNQPEQQDQNMQQNQSINDSQQIVTESRNDIRECNNTQVEETQQIEPITMRVTNSNNRTDLLESQFQSQDNIRNLMISDNYDQIGGQFYRQQNQINNHKSFDAGVFLHVEQKKQTIQENCNLDNINLSAQFESSPNQDNQQNEVIDSSRFDNASLQQQQQEVYQTPLRQRTIRSEDLNSGRSRISHEAEFKDSPDKQQSQLDFKPEEFQSQRTQENFSKQEEFGDTGRESFNYINKNAVDRSLDSQTKQLESRKSSINNDEQQDQIEPNLRHHQKIPMLRLPPSNHNNIEKDDKIDTCRTVESLINKFGQQSDHDHQNVGQDFSTPTQQPLFSNHQQSLLGSQMKKKQQKIQPLDMLFDIEESITPEQQARSVNPTPKQVDSKKHQKNTMSFGIQQDFQKMYVSESPSKSQSGLFSRQSPSNQRVELLQISQKREEDLKKTIKQEKNLKKRKEEQEQRERENKILSEKKKKQDELDQRIIQLEKDLQLKIEINKSRDSEIFDCEQRYQNYFKKIDEISISENKDEESYIQNTYNFIDDFKNQMYEKISNMKHSDPLVELMKTRFKSIYKDQFLRQQEQLQKQQIEYNLQNNSKKTQTEIIDLRIKTLVSVQPVYIVLKDIFDHLITLRARSHNVGQSFLNSQKDSYKNMLQLSKRKVFRDRIQELTNHLNYEIEESIKYLNLHQQTFQLLEIKELIANDIAVQDKLHDTICSLSDIFRERLMQIQEGEKAMMESFSSLYKMV